MLSEAVPAALQRLASAMAISGSIQEKLIIFPETNQPSALYWYLLVAATSMYLSNTEMEGQEWHKQKLSTGATMSSGMPDSALLFLQKRNENALLHGMHVSSQSEASENRLALAFES